MYNLKLGAGADQGQDKGGNFKNAQHKIISKKNR